MGRLAGLAILLVLAAGPAAGQEGRGLAWVAAGNGPAGLLTRRFPPDAFRRAEAEVLRRWAGAPEVVAYALLHGPDRSERALRAWAARLDAPQAPRNLRGHGLRALALAAAARALEDPSLRERAAIEAREAARLWEVDLAAGRITAIRAAWTARALTAAGLHGRAREVLGLARRYLVGPEGAFDRYDPAAGNGQGDGGLEANAFLGLAFLEAAEAADDPGLARAGQELGRFVWSRLRDPKLGGFFARNVALPAPGEPPFVAEKPLGPNAAAALLMVAAGRWSGQQRYLEAAARAVTALKGRITEGPEGADLLAAYRELVGPRPGRARPAFLPLLVLSFLAGVLGFLSPCSLPVLPAYFAFAAGSTRRTVLGRTVAFFLGLALSFSAMGASAGLVGAALRGPMPWIQRAAGALIAAFGVASFLGKGFEGLRLRGRPATGHGGAFWFGLAFSVGWTACVGPILAGVLVLASTREGALAGGALLFAFALGLGLPLMGVSAALGRLDRRGRVWRLLRGRAWEVRVGRRTLYLHTAGMVSGVLLLALGLLVATGQLAVLNRLVPAGAAAWVAGLEERLLGWLGSTP
ncbi:cytochrome c biogenesis CcdA family protein [Deferrisoma camini]|uniref:cytochrome c biogenesis CcdA family protein n=1 Tax=Deferrisoma camini TaxID=1035120 RepID=UPI00046D1BD3|nr:cytochrome c biogenesis CcdA family protein [Deferrisoma camini]